jgi:hypothetical protein
MFKNKKPPGNFSLIISTRTTSLKIRLLNHIFLYMICSFFKDEKEPKNLSLKEDFALQRSLIGCIFTNSLKIIFTPFILCFIHAFSDLNLPLGFCYIVHLLFKKLSIVSITYL